MRISLRPWEFVRSQPVRWIRGYALKVLWLKVTWGPVAVMLEQWKENTSGKEKAANQPENGAGV